MLFRSVAREEGDLRGRGGGQKKLIALFVVLEFLSILKLFLTNIRTLHQPLS